MDKLMLETRERCSALIALTLEQVNLIMDNFVKQAAVVANPANPANPQGLQPIAVVPALAFAEKQNQQEVSSISSYSDEVIVAPPSPQSQPDMNLVLSSDEEEEEDAELMLSDQEDEDEEDDEEDDEDELEEYDEESSIERRNANKFGKRERSEAVASSPLPPGQGKERYPLRKNPKKSRLFIREEFRGNEKEQGDDLYGHHASSESEAESDDPVQGSNSVEDLRVLLRNMHENRDMSVIQHLNSHLWSRNLFLEPLQAVRTGLGHNDKRSNSARDLFDKLMNEADASSVKLNELSGRAKVKCALCCTTRNCTNFVKFEGSYIKYPVASRCIHIAATLGKFCEYLMQLAEQMPETAGPNELKLLQQKFGAILEANQNKRFEN